MCVCCFKTANPLVSDLVLLLRELKPHDKVTIVGVTHLPTNVDAMLLQAGASTLHRTRTVYIYRVEQ